MWLVSAFNKCITPVATTAPLCFAFSFFLGGCTVQSVDTLVWLDSFSKPFSLLRRPPSGSQQAGGARYAGSFLKICRRLTSQRLGPPRTLGFVFNELTGLYRNLFPRVWFLSGLMDGGGNETKKTLDICGASVGPGRLGWHTLTSAVTGLNIFF